MPDVHVPVRFASEHSMGGQQPRHATQRVGVQPSGCREFGDRAGLIAKRVGNTDLGNDVDRSAR